MRDIIDNQHDTETPLYPGATYESGDYVYGIWNTGIRDMILTGARSAQNQIALDLYIWNGGIFENLHIRYFGKYGVRLRKAQYVHFRDFTIYLCGDDGFHITTDGKGTEYWQNPSNENRFERGEIRKNDKHGIYIDSGVNNYFNQIFLRHNGVEAEVGYGRENQVQIKGHVWSNTFERCYFEDCGSSDGEKEVYYIMLDKVYDAGPDKYHYPRGNVFRECYFAVGSGGYYPYRILYNKEAQGTIVEGCMQLSNKLFPNPGPSDSQAPFQVYTGSTNNGLLITHDNIMYDNIDGGPMALSYRLVCNEQGNDDSDAIGRNAAQLNTILLT